MTEQGQSAPPRSSRFRHRLKVGLLVFCSYQAISVLMWQNVWFTHPSSVMTCTCVDAAHSLWFLAWVPYAITHGHSPFFSTWMYAPKGVNLLANTSTPLLGFLLAPVTWLFGPVTALNLALVVSPAASAGAGYLATRHWNASMPASFIAGLIFGFSPFVLSSLSFVELNLAMLALLPLMLVVADEILVRQRGNPLLWGTLLGLLATAQFFISSEVLAIFAVLAVLGTALLVILNPRRFRQSLPYATKAIGTATVVGGVLLSWPLWFELAGPQHFSGPPWPSISIFGSTPEQLVSPNATRTLGQFGRPFPPGCYLGLPVIAACAGALVVCWKDRTVRFFAIMLALVVSFSLGSLFRTSPGLGGVHAGVWLPWRIFEHIPVVGYILPLHFGAIVPLFASIIIAKGLEQMGTLASNAFSKASRIRPKATLLHNVAVGKVLELTTITILSLAMLLPEAGVFPLPYAVQDTRVPRWFTTDGLKVPSGETMLVLPFPTPTTAEPLVWQAIAGMHFKIVGGWALLPGRNGRADAGLESGRAQSALRGLSSPWQKTPSASPRLLSTVTRAISRWGVSTVVVIDRGKSPLYALGFFTAALGRAPVHQGSLWVWYHVRKHQPSYGTSANTVLDCANEGASHASDPMYVPHCVSSRSQSTHS
ncbi:MAG: hypothetical protein ACYDEY_01845 [Acidimicrobiales bacterium]